MAPLSWTCCLSVVWPWARGWRGLREFSERAFLNDKLDLAQAEAIADLIDATSRSAAGNAVRSLQGELFYSASPIWLSRLMRAAYLL